MLGKPVPDSSCEPTGGTPFLLSAQRGEKRNLYFHPKQEIWFPFESMYGKKVRGIERSTFVLDEKGVLARECGGVEVPGHAQEVLNFAKAL